MTRIFQTSIARAIERIDTATRKGDRAMLSDQTKGHEFPRILADLDKRLENKAQASAPESAAPSLHPGASALRTLSNLTIGEKSSASLPPSPAISVPSAEPSERPAAPIMGVNTPAPNVKNTSYGARFVPQNPPRTP